MWRRSSARAKAGIELSRDTDKAEQFWKHLEPLQGALEGYCRRSAHDQSAVEDVLQEAVTTALRDFDSFAEGDTFSGLDSSLREPDHPGRQAKDAHRGPLA